MKTKKLVLKLHPEVVDALRALVATNPPLTLSGFAQDAIVLRMRSYRPATEFIAEGRDAKGRSPGATGLNSALDRADGVPWTCAPDWPVDGWKEAWMLIPTIRNDIDLMRSYTQRDPITDAEWKAVIRFMGCQPGRGKPKAEVEDD